ncbi:MAG: hypothetical protein K9J76_10760 [Polaromonas sp.]|nr:hypothetical protein [Polaromonas sp.]
MTLPISANTPQLHNVRLNQNFGDSPVGRLGNSGVQAAPAGAPRSGAAAHAAAPSPGLSLGSRILNAVTPHGLRAQPKMLAGLQATSAQVGDLLGALSKSSGHSVDGLTAKRLLDSLPQTAAPLTSRGADLGTVFSQRVSVHVKNMSTAQLVALRDGVALSQSSQLAGSAGPQLAVVKAAVGRELTQRLLDTATQKMVPVLAKLVAELPREAANPGAVAFAFHELDGAAFTVLIGHGQSQSADNGANLAALKLELIKETLSTAVDNGDISPRDLGAILGHLPSKVLRSFDDPHARGALIGTEAPFTMERMVSGAIGLRAQQAETAFTQAADALLARSLPAADDPKGSLHNMQDFARDIIAAATHLTQRREHGDINHLHFPEEMGDKSAGLLTHLERLCSPGNLLVDELNHGQLNAFSKALSSLGVERGADHVAAELSRRKDEANASFGTAMLATCTAAQSKDPQALLQSLKVFADVSSNTVQALQRLGAPIDGADKVMEFREQQSTQALQTLSTEQLGSLFAALNSPELKSLKGSLGDMGQTLLENENTAIGRQLYNASLDLASTASLVRDVLVARGLSLPDMPDEASYGTATLAPAGHAALLAEFGVQAGTNGTVNIKSGLASPAFQQTFLSNLRAIEARPGPMQALANGAETGVRQALWLDLPRADYTIKHGDGTSSPLLDRHGDAALLAGPQKEAVLSGAVAKLRELTGGNPALLRLVSEFANQNSLAGVQLGLGSADSPARMPDGTPGIPMNGTEHTAYAFQSDGDGGVLMRIDYAVAGASHFMGADGSFAALDPAASHFNASVELHFDSQLQFSVSEPVRFTYNLAPAGSVATAVAAPAPAAADSAQPVLGEPVSTAQAMQETLLEAIRAGAPAGELVANIGVARDAGRISPEGADFLLTLIPAADARGASAPVTAGVTAGVQTQTAAAEFNRLSGAFTAPSFDLLNLEAVTQLTRAANNLANEQMALHLSQPDVDATAQLQTTLSLLKVLAYNTMAGMNSQVQDSIDLSIEVPDNQSRRTHLEQARNAVTRTMTALAATLSPTNPALSLAAPSQLARGTVLYSAGSLAKTQTIVQTGIDMTRTLRNGGNFAGGGDLGGGVYCSTTDPAYVSADAGWVLKLELMDDLDGAQIPQLSEMRSSRYALPGNDQITGDQAVAGLLVQALRTDNAFLRGNMLGGDTELVMYRPEGRVRILAVQQYIGDDPDGRPRFRDHTPSAFLAMQGQATDVSPQWAHP